MLDMIISRELTPEQIKIQMWKQISPDLEIIQKLFKIEKGESDGKC
jgi:hypothetical protein